MRPVGEVRSARAASRAALYPGGHRWQPDPDSYQAEPILRSTRCGRHLELGDETRNLTPWTGRTPSFIGRMTGQTGRDGRPM